MLSPLRNRFGIPGVISVFALVFAMLGGAYAANNAGDGASASKRANKKAQKGPRGPRGKTGPAGPAGPAGPQGVKGDSGANGNDGASGQNGANGTNGTNGKSVEAIEFGPTEEPVGEPCEEKGGTELIAANGTTYACNGEEGSPWSAGGTLPPNATQTGAWTFSSEGPNVNFGPTSLYFTAISFPVPLAAELDASHSHYVKAGATAPTACDDGVAPEPSANHPEADAGNLCVFGSVLEEGSPLVVIGNFAFGSGASTAGALLSVEVSNSTPTPFFVSGTFAVTGAP